MTCAEALERVFEYIDNSTTPELSAEIEGHIAQCLKCHDRFEFEQLLKARIRQAPQPAVRVQLLHRIEQLLASRAKE